MNNFQGIMDKFSLLSNFLKDKEHILYRGAFMIDSNSAIAYVVGIVIVALIFFLLTKPFKWILKTILNGLLGGIMLIIINSIGSSIGLMIPINPLNALLVGILGFPGVLLLVLIGLIL